MCGCLKDEVEFENIIVKLGENGEIICFKDVVCIELGLEFYVLCLFINNNFVVVVLVF